MYANSSSCINWELRSEPPSPLRLVCDKGTPSPLCSLICLWLILSLPSQTGVIHPSCMILLSPQSSSQMISVIFCHLNLESVPPSNAPCTIVRPIDSRSILTNRASRSSMTPNLTNLISLFRGKCSSSTLDPATWVCACQMTDSI